MNKPLSQVFKELEDKELRDKVKTLLDSFSLFEKNVPVEVVRENVKKVLLEE